MILFKPRFSVNKITQMLHLGTNSSGKTIRAGDGDVICSRFAWSWNPFDIFQTRSKLCS